MQLLMKQLSLGGIQVGACDAIEEGKTKLAIIVTGPVRDSVQIGAFAESGESDVSRPRVARHGTDACIRTVPEQALIVELQELK